MALAPSASAYTCPDNGEFTVALQSVASGRYVSVELGATPLPSGALRARATRIGPWERFEVHCVGLDTPKFALMGSKAQWVSAELGFGGGAHGMLRSRANGIGPWETFTAAGGSGSSLPATVALKSAANNRYVSAELGYTGPTHGLLRARAGRIGPWEKFKMICLDRFGCTSR